MTPVIQQSVRFRVSPQILFEMYVDSAAVEEVFGEVRAARLGRRALQIHLAAAYELDYF